MEQICCYVTTRLTLQLPIKVKSQTRHKLKMNRVLLLQHYLEPHHMGALQDADVVGQEGLEGPEPFMKIYLKWDTERISEAWFETYGCPSMIRCGDWLTKWAVGRQLSSLSVLEAKDLQLVVGGLPLGKEFCAQMTVDALGDGVEGASKRIHSISGSTPS